jgi:peroxiredoxin Q/BCP
VKREGNCTPRFTSFRFTADPEHAVADRYGQEVKLLKFGRIPAIMVIDKQGQVLQSHYADNMRDYPANSELLAAIDAANA